MAMLKLSNLHDAENATGEVFAIAWSRFLAGQEITLPWLYKTLHNVVLHEYRRRARADRKFARAANAWVEAHTEGISDDSRVVREAMFRLDPQDGEVLWLLYFEELTAEAAAQVLGCTPAAARKRAERARLRLRTLLIADGFGAGQEVAS